VQIISAQVISFDFPKLSGDTAWLYTFAGSRVDSFSVVLNAKGRAKAEFPQKGMGYLYIPQAGGTEVIFGEPELRITCNEPAVHSGTVQFAGSKENAYLRDIFRRRASLMERQEWLQAGQRFVGDKEDAAFAASLTKLLRGNEHSMRSFDDSIAASPFYAARFMELTLFMQRLYAAVQKPDSAAHAALRSEIEQQLNIDALYTSGNLWTDVHTYYGGLFSLGSNDDNQKAYAASVGKTLSRLHAPVRAAFFSSAVSACEKNNRPLAAEQIIKDFVRNNPDISVTDTKLQRILSMYRVEKGLKPPALSGLSETIEQPAILIFFDSNCDHCRHELDRLTEHYAALTAKGYRIISIAADTQQNNYLNYAAAFPWDKADRLCDFKGFDGDNFKNYGIIGTPTIFELNKDGVIVGKYAQMKEINE
jgi:hypothetical protein